MQVVSSSKAHRVAFITGGLKLGGSTTFLLNIAGEFVRRGIPVEVLSFESDHPLAADFQAQKIPLLCLNERRMIYEDRLKQILQRLGQFQPTVVVSTLGPASFEVLRYLPGGVFRIGMAQSHDPNVYRMMRLYAKWMDLVVMVSKTMQQATAGLPEFSSLPVICLPYGVPMPNASQIVQPDPKRPLRILYLGRLEQEQKRVRLFPQIWAQLVQIGIPVHWTIAGDGPELGFLRENLRPGSVDQVVEFLGPVGYADVPAVLRKHDVFLLASDYEGLPLSLLEAMGHGLVPVVSALESGICEVVDATNGLLVPVDDVAGYARAIIHLHRHRSEIAAKSAAARARVEKDFSVAAMTDRWLAALPTTPTQTGPWPKPWCIQAPLTAPNKFRFSPPIRWLRRLGAGLHR